MRVFISWAKEPSRVVAEALRDWLPDVILLLEPWVSSADIGAGARWGDEIARALNDSAIGIICVTHDNQREPWLLFEAGALAKSLEKGFVCPYLIQMPPSDLAAGPLTQFQTKTATKDGTFDLVSTINRALGTQALPLDRLRRLFERAWPDLEAKLNALPHAVPAPRREPSDMISEVLETVRSIARRLPEASPEMFAQRARQAREFAILRAMTSNESVSEESEAALRARLGHLSDSDLEQLYSDVQAALQPKTTSQSVEADETTDSSGGARQRSSARGALAGPLDPRFDL